jgi:hypothetical protein
MGKLFSEDIGNSKKGLNINRKGNSLQFNVLPLDKEVPHLLRDKPI